MPKFRKKPVVIEAVRWDGSSIEAMMEFLRSGAPWPQPTDGHIKPGIGFTPPSGSIFIPTEEGTMEGKPGDWIIKGVKSEFYPCKPDIFEATYEPVSQMTQFEIALQVLRDYDEAYRRKQSSGLSTEIPADLACALIKQIQANIERLAAPTEGIDQNDLMKYAVDESIDASPAPTHWIEGPALYNQPNDETWWEAYGLPSHKMGCVYAKRSDGETFFVVMLVKSPDDAKAAIKTATQRLNTFETCPCRAGATCEKHKEHPGAVREGGQLPTPWVKT